MKQKLITSLFVSIEWRVIAFIITNLFLWIVTGEFWHATLMAFSLQLILFFVHFCWYFLRQEQLNHVRQ